MRQHHLDPNLIEQKITTGKVSLKESSSETTTEWQYPGQQTR